MSEPERQAAELPCEFLPPPPQEEIKRGVEHDRGRAMAADDDERPED